MRRRGENSQRTERLPPVMRQRFLPPIRRKAGGHTGIIKAKLLDKLTQAILRDMVRCTSRCCYDARLYFAGIISSQYPSGSEIK